MTAEPAPIPITESPRAALVEMLRIAAPTIASMTSFTIMQFVDKYFCGQLGVEELAAAGNGGIASWFPMSVMAALLGVVNTFVSQNLGAGRPERGAAYVWTSMWMSWAYWLILLVPYAIFLPEVFSAMRHAIGVASPGQHIIDMETSYSRILLFGAFITLSSRALHQFFFGMHKPGIVAAGVILGNAVNFVLTWAFVFGELGLPRLGVPGSALGTVIGTCVELALPAVVFVSASYRKQWGTLASWRFSPSHMKEIVRIGWPAGLMFGSEMICWWVFTAGLVAQFGSEHNTAGWITLQYMHISFMPAVGMSIAVQAIVGKCIGAGRPDIASKRAWLGVRVTMVYMGLCAACFVLFRHQLINVFRSDTWTPEQASEIMRIAGPLLILAAVFQLFDAMGITMVGALRGAGDTLWPGVMTVVLSWGVLLAGGKAITMYRPDWQSFGPWLAAAVYIILFALGVGWRWHTGKWRSIKVLPSDAGGLAGGSEPADPLPVLSPNSNP